MEDRQFVEGHWKYTHQCDGSYKGHLRGTVLLMLANHVHIPCRDWSEAAEYTRKTLAEIQTAEVALRELMALRDRWGEVPQWKWLHSLATERLAQLKRGLK